MDEAIRLVGRLRLYPWIAWRQVAVVFMLCLFSLVDPVCCAALVLFRFRSPLIHPTHTNK